MTRHIAVIGAGMAGLSAASLLARAGFSVTVFEKSRGLGGRMATRRAGELRFDHGAQYFTARGPGFQAEVARWRAAGAVREWFEGGYVGAPSMNAPATELANGLSVTTGRTVTRLSLSAGRWSVSDAEGPVEALGNGAYEAAILAVPAPQALPLAASAGVALPGLERAVYAPCWALMLGFASAAALAGDRHKPDDDMIGWIARNSAKPGRDAWAETIVAHAGPAWSRTHLEWAPEAAQDALLARFRRLTGVQDAPAYASAHRWRFALVEQALGEPCLWDEASRLGACGDWALGPRVEAAFDSGQAMAARALAALGVAP